MHIDTDGCCVPEMLRFWTSNFLASPHQDQVAWICNMYEQRRRDLPGRLKTYRMIRIIQVGGHHRADGDWPAAAAVPFRMAAGHERRGPWGAQTQTAPKVSRAKARAGTSLSTSGMAMNNPVPTKRGTAMCQCLSWKRFAE